MKALDLVTDTYERKARLYPALVLLAPVVVLAVTAQIAEWSALRAVAAVVVGCGGAFLLAQLARDEGKRREKLLYALWGGKPSVTIFRHQDGRLGTLTKLRYHQKLETLVKGAKAPTVEQENADPRAADQTYEAWSDYLRTHTRDTKAFELLFRENVNYGYRRNLWGIRPAGIALSSLCLAASGFLGIRQYRNTGEVAEPIALACIFELLCLALWLLRFSPSWVRIPADAYSERLAEAAEKVGAKAPGERKAK